MVDEADSGFWLFLRHVVRLAENYGFCAGLGYAFTYEELKNFLMLKDAATLSVESWANDYIDVKPGSPGSGFISVRGVRTVWEEYQRGYKKLTDLSPQYCLHFLRDTVEIKTTENAEAISRAIQEELARVKTLDFNSLPEWFIIQRFADYLGIKPESARKHAKRHGFRKDRLRKGMVHREDAWPSIQKAIQKQN